MQSLLLSQTGNDSIQSKEEKRRRKMLKVQDINVFQGEGTCLLLPWQTVMSLGRGNLSFIDILRFSRMETVMETELIDQKIPGR